jgi:hypothetical protein
MLKPKLARDCYTMVLGMIYRKSRISGGIFIANRSGIVSAPILYNHYLKIAHRLGADAIKAPPQISRTVINRNYYGNRRRHN